MGVTGPGRQTVGWALDDPERVQGAGFAGGDLDVGLTPRRAELPAWLYEYHHHRPHTACGNEATVTRPTNLLGQYG